MPRPLFEIAREVVVPEKFHQPDRYPCPFLREGVHILTNGDVIACCRDSDYEVVMGNAFATAIREIWNGEKYRHFRHLHAMKRWNEIPICSRCDTWMCKNEENNRRRRSHGLSVSVYRQYVAVMKKSNSHWTRNALKDIWGAVKNTTRRVTSTLVHLNPLRKAS